MRIRILGSAAGGGLPQWNCRCANCEAARRGAPDVQARTQSSIAVTADNRSWFLLNVSADVRQQLTSFEGMWPPDGDRRGTTIAGCLLTDAEIDHSSGLLQLREGSAFRVFSTPTVRRWLNEFFPIGSILVNFAERPWTELPLDETFELTLLNGAASGLRVRTFEVGRDVPRFVPEKAEDAVGSVVGFEIEDSATGGKLVYAPGVATLCESLVESTDGADCILIDGTFWTDDEPIDSGITERTAREMGHIPVSGPGGTLHWLAELPVRHRVYVHINNTNPMLNDRGPQRREVDENGVRVGADGDEFDV